MIPVPKDVDGKEIHMSREDVKWYTSYLIHIIRSSFFGQGKAQTLQNVVIPKVSQLLG